MSVETEQSTSNQSFIEDEEVDNSIDMDSDSYEQTENELNLRVQYQIMNAEEVKQDIDKEVKTALPVLGLTYEQTFRVLQFCNWKARIIEEYFTDMQDMQAKAGIVTEAELRSYKQSKEYQQRESSFQNNNDQGLCQICFTEVDRKDLRSSSCQKHFYCIDCWSNHLKVSLETGRSVVDMRCPEPKCKAYVQKAIFEELLDQQGLERYQKFVLDTYIQAKPRLTWCTGPNCEYIVKCNMERSFDNPLDVTCTYCNTKFCFVCRQDAHEPVTCTIVKSWISKNQAESENTTYILALCKPCPNCKTNIEKNAGCMHMTCTICKQEFCWLCTGVWKKHGQGTGGYYDCNKYQEGKRSGQLSKEDEVRDKAKRHLDRYMHYFERFDFHDKSKKRAIEDLKNVQDRLEELSFQTNTPQVQLKCIIDAWQQVIDCRRILSWTYAYGFYQFMTTTDERHQQPQDNKVKDFFEFTQGEMEYTLDRLHTLLEQDLKRIFDQIDRGYIDCGEKNMSSTRNKKVAFSQRSAKLQVEDIVYFSTLRQNLINNTGIVKQYFQKLVMQMHQGINCLVNLPSEADQDNQGNQLDEVDPTKEKKHKQLGMRMRRVYNLRSINGSEVGQSHVL